MQSVLMRVRRVDVGVCVKTPVSSISMTSYSSFNLQLVPTTRRLAEPLQGPLDIPLHIIWWD